MTDESDLHRISVIGYMKIKRNVLSLVFNEKLGGYGMPKNLWIIFERVKSSGIWKIWYNIELYRLYKDNDLVKISV